MTFNQFNVEITDKIATVTINRPDKSNAFTLDMWEELGKVFNYISNEPTARVAILKGAGKNFSAGMDLSVFAGIPGIIQADTEEEKTAKLKTFILGLQENISSIEKCSVPVIAAIQGACIGGAINIASACDMRYSCDATYISIKEVDLGIVADIGVLQRLPKVMSPSIVAELTYTGRNVYGKEAKSLGLVNDNFDSQETMEARVLELAHTIASKSPKVIRGIKKMMLEQRSLPVYEALDHMATYNSKHLFSPDLAEAMSAYFEKRQPNFED